MHPSLLSCLMGTYIHWVLLFAWVLLLKKWIATGFMGTYIHRVLVFDGYLYSRVYGNSGGSSINSEQVLMLPPTDQTAKRYLSSHISIAMEFVSWQSHSAR